ncbi:MAG TPA: hypothetical protein ENI80_03005 [Acidiferrobacteraceae bacterium]|nr:hypothetical protein [Acidiferrobacteraceae bacterium]
MPGREWCNRSMDIRICDGFAVVRDILQRTVHSYLPLLNYTDRQATGIRCLSLSRCIGRVINPAEDRFRENDPVTMRLPLYAAEHENELWTCFFKGRLSGVKRIIN